MATGVQRHRQPWESRQHVTVAGINVTKAIHQPQIYLATYKVFSKNTIQNTVVPELYLYLDVYTVHE